MGTNLLSLERLILGVLGRLANVRFCPKADVRKLAISKPLFPRRRLKGRKPCNDSRGAF